MDHRQIPLIGNQKRLGWGSVRRFLVHISFCSMVLLNHISSNISFINLLQDLCPASQAHHPLSAWPESTAHTLFPWHLHPGQLQPGLFSLGRGGEQALCRGSFGGQGQADLPSAVIFSWAGRKTASQKPWTAGWLQKAISSHYPLPAKQLC